MSMHQENKSSESWRCDFGEISHLYSPIWNEALDALAQAMQQRILAIVDEGHAQFFPLRTMQRLLQALPESDRNDRKMAHADELMALASSRLDEEHHRNCALAIGMNHAMEGIAYDELVQTHAILMATVSRHIDTAEHEDALEIFTRREYRSLALYAEAYAQADALYSTALLEITRLIWRAETYTDFINQVVQTLSKHLPILGCSMGCSDEHGVFRFEATAGTGMHDFILEMENSLQPVVSEGSQGPTARAWSDGRIAHCLHFETDHRMVFWCAAARRAGCRSSAAVPLAISSSAPKAVLSLYSRLAGGFVGNSQLAFLEQLQTILTLAVSRIEGQNGDNRRPVSYSKRRHWAELLRTSALEMHYQPLLHLKTGRVTKVEALARLRDDGRLLTPGQFFPALSSNDFVVLYERGLEQSLKLLRRWNDAGHELVISVNLPSSALGDARYFNATRHALAQHEVAPRQLMLEILEDEEISHDINVTQELMRYKNLGITLAEDDLGSGHSSLARLRELPFDSVKIDRGLSTLSGKDSLTALRFVHQLTRLGHSLGKSVVVEGVEEPEMLMAMKILGVDLVQGYVIAKPMSEKDLHAWLQCHQWGDPLAPAVESSLVRLVQLLLWEERLNLALSRAAYEHCWHANDSAQHDDNSTPPWLVQLQADLTSACPTVMAHVDAASKLIRLALLNGTNSAEYVSERSNLVQVLAHT